MSNIMWTIKLALTALAVTLITLIAAPAAAQPTRELFEPPDDDVKGLDDDTAGPTPSASATTTVWENPCKDEPGSTWCAVLSECIPNAKFKELCKKVECDGRKKIKDPKTGRMRCETPAEVASAVFAEKYAEKEKELWPKIKKLVKELVADELSTATKVVGSLFAIFLAFGLWLRFRPLQQPEERVTKLEGRVDQLDKDFEKALKD